MNGIDYSNLKVGDTFYGVKETNTAFFRKKIHRVIDGEDWFKYDNPLRTYSIAVYTVIGVLKKELNGVWDNDYEVETEYHISSVIDGKENTFTCDANYFKEDRTLNLGIESNYFYSEEKALSFKKELEAAAREMELK